MTNREHWKAMLPVIQAYAEGKEIQAVSSGKWKSLGLFTDIVLAEQCRKKAEMNIYGEFARG